MTSSKLSIDASSYRFRAVRVLVNKSGLRSWKSSVSISPLYRCVVSSCRVYSTSVKKSFSSPAPRRDWAGNSHGCCPRTAPQRRVGAESDLDGAIMLLGLARLALHGRRRGGGGRGGVGSVADGASFPVTRIDR